ncbi:MAG: sigma-54 dependent transcriptional regulator [Acidobacteriota bacterium]
MNAVGDRRDRSGSLFALNRGPSEPSTPLWRTTLVGNSPAMEQIADVIARVADRRATVLITGETGTGKEVAARALHLASRRAKMPMVTVNTAALPENLLEAELFGHVKGAFTGAVGQRVGRFEQAHRSTLFLDEIGDLPLEMQTKLLRFLQEREFQRVGSSETVQVDVRVVAATNVDLLERVAQGKFREDLYYRLNVVPLRTPALRERREDIVPLAQHFARKISEGEGLSTRSLSQEAIVYLLQSNLAWKGNVRELENRVERAIALSGDRELLVASDFATPATNSLPGDDPLPPNWTSSLNLPDAGLDFEATVASIERQFIQEALQRTDGNKTAAAELLCLKRTTLSAKMQSLRMDGPEASEAPKGLAAANGF